MADIFISYSKKHAQLTEDLARDLEAEGYTTWWDTSLLPGHKFPNEIKRQIEAATAVIVIWTENSVKSEWVLAEATLANARKKLITVRDAGLDVHEIPLPFNTWHAELASERAKIFAALARRGIVPIKSEKAFAGQFPLGSMKFEPHAVQKGRVKVMVGTRMNTRGLWLKPGESFRDIPDAPEMVVIPAGSFIMGSKEGEGFDWERPQHKVTIPRAFAVGKHPVTFDEWDAAVAAKGISYRPSDEGWGRGRRPVINVSWGEAQAYIKWLSATTGQPYRLLSEAEWEYACRAGTTTAYSFGNKIARAQAQFSEGGWGSGNRTVEVGSFAVNKFGLYDMHGNVWEWCQDCWNDTYKGVSYDGSAWTTRDRTQRVLRGGSWFSDPSLLRSAYRNWHARDYRYYDIGFRVARVVTL